MPEPVLAPRLVRGVAACAGPPEGRRHLRQPGDPRSSCVATRSIQRNWPIRHSAPIQRNRLIPRDNPSDRPNNQLQVMYVDELQVDVVGVEE